MVLCCYSSFGLRAASHALRILSQPLSLYNLRRKVYTGYSSIGRAPGLGPGGSRFKPEYPEVFPTRTACPPFVAPCGLLPQKKSALEIGNRLTVELGKGLKLGEVDPHIKCRKSVICPACVGAGKVCCHTWAVVRAQSGGDLKFNGLGMPLWPLAAWLEMPCCPFCGREFEITRRPRRNRLFQRNASNVASI